MTLTPEIVERMSYLSKQLEHFDKMQLELTPEIVECMRYLSTQLEYLQKIQLELTLLQLYFFTVLKLVLIDIAIARLFR